MVIENCIAFDKCIASIERVIVATLLHHALSAAQCIIIGHVCLWLGVCVCVFVGGWVCYHDNSKLRASILTIDWVCIVTISIWLNFGSSVPPGKGSAAGQFLAPSYYSQRAVFASLWALFSLYDCARLPWYVVRDLGVCNIIQRPIRECGATLLIRYSVLIRMHDPMTRISLVLSCPKQQFIQIFIEIQLRDHADSPKSEKNLWFSADFDLIIIRSCAKVNHFVVFPSMQCPV